MRRSNDEEETFIKINLFSYDKEAAETFSEFSVNIVLNLKVSAKQSYEVMSLLPVSDSIFSAENKLKNRQPDFLHCKIYKRVRTEILISCFK